MTSSIYYLSFISHPSKPVLHEAQNTLFNQPRSRWNKYTLSLLLQEIQYPVCFFCIVIISHLLMVGYTLTTWKQIKRSEIGFMNIFGPFEAIQINHKSKTQSGAEHWQCHAKLAVIAASQLEYLHWAQLCSLLLLG